MIDVVFLLLVFFMLAARFGTDTARPLTLPATGAATPWQGPPRLVEVTPAGLRLNGVALSPEVLPDRLAALLPAPGAPILVQPRQGADLQRLLDLLDSLTARGFNPLLIEGD